MYVWPGRYFKLGYRYRGQYSNLSTSYWDVASKLDVNITGTYNPGITSGMIGGAKVASSWYALYLMDTGHVLALPYVRVGNRAYSAPNTVINPCNHVVDATWQSTLNTDDAGNQANRTFRQVLTAADISNSGHLVRAQLCTKLSATANILQLDNVSIGVRSGSTADYTSIPTELLFSGGHGFTSISAPAAIISDWTIFSLNEAADHLFVMDVGNTTQYIRYNNAAGTLYYKDATNSYNTDTLSGAGSVSWAGTILGRLDSLALNNGFMVANDTWNNYRLVRMKYGDANDNKVYTIADTVNGSPDQILISTDVTSEISLADWFMMIPSTETDFVYIGSVFFDSNGNLTNFIKNGWITSFMGASQIALLQNQGHANLDLGGVCPPVASSIRGYVLFDPQADQTTDLTLMYLDSGTTGDNVMLDIPGINFGSAATWRRGTGYFNFPISATNNMRVYNYSYSSGSLVNAKRYYSFSHGWDE